VTVVIPAYNEEKYITDCLESVIATQYPHLEIILVDDKSTDKTVETATRYPVKIIVRESRGGVAVARNEGLQAARGEIVAFVDADCVVDRPWLELLISDYTYEKIAGVGGIIGTKQSDILGKYRSFTAREPYTDSPTPVATLYIPGGNSSYRSDVLRSIGGFDPAFAQPRAHEVIELGYRMKKHGHQLIGEPRAIVWHMREGSLRSWISGAFSQGYSALSFLVRYRIGELLSFQLKQIALICFLGLWIMAFLGFIPLRVAFDVSVVVLLIELLRAGYSASKAAAHYRDARYFVVIPIELMLRIILYSGYFTALFLAMYHVTIKFVKRVFLGRQSQTDEASSSGSLLSLISG
jgi:glycosyltransferase involved in cell wall biosynthesis